MYPMVYNPEHLTPEQQIFLDQDLVAEYGIFGKRVRVIKINEQTVIWADGSESEGKTGWGFDAEKCFDLQMI